MYKAGNGVTAWDWDNVGEREAAIAFIREVHKWEVADRRGRKSKNKPTYSTMRVSLDTETTTWRPRTLCGAASPHRHYNLKRDCANCPANAANGGSCRAYAWIYVWQICVSGKVIMGRDCASMLLCLHTIASAVDADERHRVLVYAHNLSYEMGFFLHLLDRVEDDAIYTDRHKVLRVHTSGGIEFRCSYLLSGTSLEVVGRNLQSGVLKATGKLRYREIRTPKTPLTAEELTYCVQDVLVMDEYLKEQYAQYEKWSKIPLTNTGRVRNACRESCLASESYKKTIKRLTIRTAEMYSEMKHAFSGGVVHGGMRYIGKTVENVGTCDIASSYPAQILLKDYPMGPFTEVANPTPASFKSMYGKKAILVDVTLRDVKPRHIYAQVMPFYRAKAHEGKFTLNNGKVLYADALRYTFTGEELVNMLRFYRFSLQINRMWYAARGHLPKELITTMLDFYDAKTTLKGVAGREAEYMLKKNMLNSIYGMMVTSLDMEDWIVDANGDFVKAIGDKESVDYKEWLDGVIQGNDKSRRRFLYYAWGVWVTTWARDQLYRMILSVGEDFVYCDTDCVKMTHPEKYIGMIEATNAEITQQVRRAERHYKLQEGAFSPKSPKGKVCTIGLWEYEGEYTRFKALGAKRYMGEHNGALEVTVAGCNKEKLRDWLNDCPWDPFDLFGPDLVVPAEHSGRLTMTYLTGEGDLTVTDMYGNVDEVHYSRGIAAEPNEYSFAAQREFVQWARGMWERTEKDG